MGTRTAARRCQGKTRYDSQSGAAQTLERFVREGSSREILRTYLCDGSKGCGGWHVGHRLPPTGRRRRG